MRRSTAAWGVLAVNVPNVRRFLVPLARFTARRFTDTFEADHLVYFSPSPLARSRERVEPPERRPVAWYQTARRRAR